MKATIIAALFAVAAAAVEIQKPVLRAEMPPALPNCLSPPKGMKPEPCNPKTDCNYCALTMNDLVDKPCREITWIFARASTEFGNMGASVGTLIAQGLNTTYGKGSLASQGVDYSAGLMTNVGVGGMTCDPKGVTEAKRLINLAHSKCPKTILLVGGYSQGTCVMHKAIPGLSAAVRDQIAAAVMFGDTRNKQDKGQIPDYPPSKTKIFCNSGDHVCENKIDASLLGAHLKYHASVPPALDFLISHINAAKGGKAAPAGDDSDSDSGSDSGSDSSMSDMRTSDDSSDSGSASDASASSDSSDSGSMSGMGSSSDSSAASDSGSSDDSSMSGMKA